ncbi:response regulator transcription factor [Cohnella boryungensis]|uniref:Response regulator n=1 Tax=Cohnella boryungensis TaxID=768479 RepID=A0ABV8S5X9_9BACL
MYRVFLVDDEPFIVEGLSDGVDWSHYGLEICGTAGDGRQALERLREVPADILVTDITMPFMNGLDLIRQVRAFRPEIKVIILSGYNEFDYLKEGMRLGIENYLLKPIHFEELYATLGNTVEKLNADLQPAGYNEEVMDILKDNVLYRWITERIDAEQLNERARMLGFELEGQFVQAGIVRHKEADKALGSMRRLAKSRATIHCFRDNEGDSVAVFLGESAEQCRESGLAFMQAVQQTFVSSGGFISLGSIEKRGSERLAYRNAQQAMESLLMLGRSEIGRYELLSFAPENGTQAFELDWESYRPLLLSNDSQRLEARIDADFRAMQASEGITPDHVRGAVIEAVVRMKMELRKLKQSESSFEERYRTLFRQAYHAPDSERLLQALQEVARLSSEELVRADTSPIIKQVLKHVQTHYAEDLSLKSLGSRFNAHPVYLGRLFQRETNEAFTEYLNKIRIEKAKELLGRTTLKVHEVSKEVGYWEPSYFHKQFKKHVGITPTEFKALL